MRIELTCIDMAEFHKCDFRTKILLNKRKQIQTKHTLDDFLYNKFKNRHPPGRESTLGVVEETDVYTSVFKF